MALQRTRHDLAAAILNMTYGELMAVSEEFAGMTATDNGCRPHPKTAEHFASLLHDWAEALADNE